MEEEILKIIRHNDFKESNDNASPDRKRMDAAKEITSHIMEFIEWVLLDTTPFQYDGEICLTFSDENGLDTKTIPESYVYWLNNIKK
jgi:hypothetical protein